MKEGGAISSKTVAIIIVACLLLLIVVGGAIYILESKSEEKGDLVIYTYDSFVAEWGLGPKVIPLFEEKYDVNVTVLPQGDVGGIIDRLEIEKDDPKADIALGIDNSMLHMAVEEDLLETYTPPNLDRVNQSLVFDPEHHLIPYDYGYIAIICNRELMEERNLPVPDKLTDLADSIYRDQILLIDPATSSTGASFMIWAAQVTGDEYPQFFQDLAENRRALYDTWDNMYYNGYMEGEAPIAISYGLDTAFEMSYYGTHDNITVVPQDHGYRQIEGAGIVKGAKNRSLAEKFIQFMISDQFQEHVESNVMLPVVDGIEISEYFREYGEYATEHAEGTQSEIGDNYRSWLNEWDQAFA